MFVIIILIYKINQLIIFAPNSYSYIIKIKCPLKNMHKYNQTSADENHMARWRQNQLTSITSWLKFAMFWRGLSSNHYRIVLHVNSLAFTGISVFQCVCFMLYLFEFWSGKVLGNFPVTFGRGAADHSEC